jgi:hypothetical protein
VAWKIGCLVAQLLDRFDTFAHNFDAARSILGRLDNWMYVRFDTHFDNFACFGAPRFDYADPDHSDALASIPWSLVLVAWIFGCSVASTLARIILLASMLLARMLARIDT